MIRKLGSLGLMLAVVCGCWAPVATAQSGILTAETYPAFAEGIQFLGVTTQITAFGESIQCGSGGGDAEISEATQDITVTATNPGGCVVGSLPATVTTNGCDVALHIGNAVGGNDHVYGGSVDLLCPEGKSIEVHIYTGGAHSFSVCTLKMPPQKGLTGGTSTNNTKNGTVTIEGAINGLHFQREGLCGAGTTKEGVFEGKSTVTAKDSAGEPNRIEVSTAP